MCDSDHLINTGQLLLLIIILPETVPVTIDLAIITGAFP